MAYTYDYKAFLIQSQGALKPSGVTGSNIFCLVKYTDPSGGYENRVLTSNCYLNADTTLIESKQFLQKTNIKRQTCGHDTQFRYLMGT